MALKKIMAAAAALSLAAAPTAVSAQSAPSEIAPAGETVEGSELRGGNYLGLAVVFVLVVLIYFIAREDDKSASP